MRILTEGKAKFYAPTAKIVSKDMPVFYNPVMKTNRDIAVAIVASSGRKMRIADPLAGTGIRSIRILLEAGKNAESIAINDVSPSAVRLIKKNLRLNKLSGKKISIANTEANKFLLESKSFDYIDIDPFGYPGIFLESAIKRISQKGIIAITATDTAALAGTAPKACMRKYWAIPLRNELMHEIGLRIMIRRVQITAAAFEKAAVPVLSYFKDHYARAFFRMERGASKADSILKQHKMFFYCSKSMERGIGTACQSCGEGKEVAGPLWTGPLWERETLISAMKKTCNKETRKFLGTIAEEARVDSVGFYDIHKVCKSLQIAAPKTAEIMKRLRKRKIKAAMTHFSNRGIRANAGIKEIKKFIKAASAN
ncbi:tRNA (guanine(10)-N(2))-dimethyltransferase [Candidatus Woesearchaeota archaeon]|nr:tRNA (guanine(10)-N(2))-dimethyltransferase [Candidatus Woesearchaeota archaeon]